MITKLQKTFGLTRSGARSLVRASLTSMLSNIAYMAPVFLIMLFAQGVLEGALPSLGFFIGGIALLGLFMYATIHINYNTLYNATYEESAALRIEIANTLKALPLSYFSKHDISDLSQTIMADVAAIEHAMSHAIPQTIGLSAFLALVAISMIAFHPALGLCVFAPIVVSVVLVFLSKKIQVAGTTKDFKKQRERSEFFQEAIEMQQEIKSYGKAEDTERALLRNIDESESQHIMAEMGQAIPLNIALVFLNFSIGLTVFFGLKMYLGGTASLLYLLGYIVAAARVKDSVAGVEANLAEIMYLDARIARINELRETKTQTGEKTEIESYDIAFRDVGFAYTEGQKIIDGISFTAKQNEVTALIGPSGCGKTTVLRLASRLYDYDTGSIAVGGKEISAIDTDSLFEKISIVFQDVGLFNTSVLENIRLGDRHASDDEVKKAARLANCEEFIMKLPKGYDTVIGENGGTLSGGERQRLSIARAFLKNAPIIILDEISASLDVENEMKIQESLHTLIKNKTVIIISHRLKSVEKADKIVVMNNGDIDAQGSHAYVLEHSRLYRNMIKKSGMTEQYMY